MNTQTQHYQTAVKNALTGWLTKQDLLTIVRHQTPELGSVTNTQAATLVIYQAMFN